MSLQCRLKRILACESDPGSRDTRSRRLWPVTARPHKSSHDDNWPRFSNRIPLCGGAKWWSVMTYALEVEPSIFWPTCRSGAYASYLLGSFLLTTVHVIRLREFCPSGTPNSSLRLLDLCTPIASELIPNRTTDRSMPVLHGLYCAAL